MYRKKEAATPQAFHIVDHMTPGVKSQSESEKQDEDQDRG